ncbi:IS630 family transposase [Microbulbifer sp. TRSA007]|uniref:IS630 family transposase n=1 Tax=unclassified Microbulbifer TaxID=2619833 RepID=UPI0040393FD4
MVAEQLKLNYALWTCKTFMELIEREFGIKMSIRTVGDYLKRWDFTPQKPAIRAYEQNPKVVKKWMEEDYPYIKQRAKKEGAEIYWGDETDIRSDCQHERGYAPKGKPPIVKLTAKRASLNMILAITNQGTVRFQIYEGSMNADRLIGFLKRLIKTAGRKVYLILDNLRVHHARVIKAWLSEHEDEIEKFYLSSYSPELNPDEYLNFDLKGGVYSGIPIQFKKS